MKAPIRRKLLTPRWPLIQTRIPPDLAKWLDGHARGRLLTVAAVLRLLVAEARASETSTRKDAAR